MSYNFYYKQVGNIEVGFMKDPSNTPYLLSYISYRGSENLLDNYRRDRGREFQSTIFDGTIPPGKDFMFNIVNPTFGGGNWGKTIPIMQNFQETFNTLEVTCQAYDYTQEISPVGPYRERMLGNHYPECGWNCTTKYTIESNSVKMEVEYWITDSKRHNIFAFRPMVLHLNPESFQYPLINEDKRDMDSWLQAVIRDDHIGVETVDGGLKVKITAGVDSPKSYRFTPYLSHRCFKMTYDLWDQEDNVADGSADVWEAMLVVEPHRIFSPATEFKGWARIDIQPTKVKLNLCGLMQRIKDALKRRKKMQVLCNDGEIIVTEIEYKWLKDAGYFMDYSNYPTAPQNKFDGSEAQLESLLDTMPEDWEDITEPDMPESPTLNIVDLIAELDDIVDKLNDVITMLGKVK